MGTMMCDRTGCNNVCCDRLSDRFGYICDRCFDDLIRTRTMDIRQFMLSEKPDMDENDLFAAWAEKVFRRL